MFFCLPAIFVGFLASLYAQHIVNDITEYGGWYKVKIEMLPPGNTMYFITQCYPSGDEYDVIGDEKEKLPLHLEVLCMAMIREGMGNSFDWKAGAIPRSKLHGMVLGLPINLLITISP
jgi:hypothetical protein